eukprot:CAMPEP_0181311182 /NCGR_PEP_ID=MMETSP1101-20121128/12995_1 /TAXON_ID=46948 /ORGANISM="Rhodomonas abbreviata, Strain Caron Lab Isolate" /LENGTH=336 /DNA_ID=CAMNT_0023417885 /DNA_START=197 /DNA_END=1204 /DNA_ORIENTATION=-
MPASEASQDAVELVARKRADATVQGTELSLIEAEHRCTQSIQNRQRAEDAVKDAMSMLRQAEATYSGGCNSLESLSDEYGEARLEVEIALENAELALLEANSVSNRALLELKNAEEEANDAFLALRQAEMEHEKALQRIARMDAKSCGVGFGAPLLQSVGGEGGNLRGSGDDEGSQNTDSTVEDPFQEGNVSGMYRSPGKEREADETDGWPELGGSALRVLRGSPKHGHANGHSPPRHETASRSPGREGKEVLLSSPPFTKARAGTIPISVRLMGFGCSRTCLGPAHKEQEVLTPTETRTLLEALGGTAPIQVACSEKHALMVAESGEVFAWGDAG